MQKNSNTDYPKLSFITNSSLNQLLIIQNQPQLQLSPKHKSNTKILSKPPSLEILIELLTNQNKLYENKQQIIDYLRALNPFDSIIKQFHMNNTNEVYKEIIKLIKYTFIPKHNIVIHLGDFCEKFYVILSGKVDVLALKEKKCVLYLTDYLRYLGHLIGYGEYDVVSRVINLNFGIYPLEIEGMKNNYGKFTNTISVQGNSINGKKIHVITLDDIFLLLNAKEKEKFENNFNFININKNNSFVNNKNNNTYVTSECFISRLQSFERRVNNISIPSNNNEQLITVKLLLYYHTTTLKSGNKFGDIPLNEPLSKRNITVITNENTHFGFISKENYPNLLREANDSFIKKNTVFLLSTKLFSHSIPAGIFTKRYNMYFVKIKKKKNKLLLGQHLPVHNLFILTKGTLDVICTATLHELSEYIDYIYNLLKVRNKEIIALIDKIKIQDEKLKSRCCEIERLHKFFYYTKHNIKISSISSIHFIGLAETFMPREKTKNNDYCSSTFRESFFSYKVQSNLIEGFALDLDIYNMMKENHEELIENEIKILHSKINSMIQRLYTMRENKLKSYFEEFPDYFFFPEYVKDYNEINIYNDILHLKLKPAKRTKDLITVQNNVPKVKKIKPKRTNTTCLRNLTPNSNNLLGYLKESKSISKEADKNIIKITNSSIDINLSKHKKHSISQNSIIHKMTQFKSTINNKGQKDITINDIVKQFSSLKLHKININHSNHGNKELIYQMKKYSNDNAETLNNLIINNYPFSSLLVKQSLAKTRAQSAVNIFSYNQYKNRVYLERRNSKNIKKTRESFLRFNRKMSYIYK